MFAVPVRVVHTRRDRLRGTCCAGVTDHDPEMTVLSIDGTGADDHVYRSS